MANLADLGIGVFVDADEVTSGMDAAGSSVEDFEATTSRAGQFIEDNFLKMGAAAVGIGAGLEGFARSQQASNVGFERMGRVTGEGADKMRDMASSLQNVTFPMEDVTALMETATQRGLQGDAIAEYATFWDMVGDATGEAGPALGEAGVALGLVGIAAGDEAEALDAFGYITDNTTGSVEGFLGFIEKTATELGDATPNVNDMAGALGALEDKGLSSRRAQRELRTALSETDGDMVKALETLGVSEDAYNDQVKAVEDSSGAIEANAQAYADSFTPMQRMSAKLENVMTQYGGLASAAGAVSAPLAGVGSAMMGVSMVAPKLVSKIGTLVGAIGTKIAAVVSWAAATAAQGAKALASMAVTTAKFIAHYVRMAAASMASAVRMAASWVIAMGPVGWVIAGIVALVALIIANWDKVKEWTGRIWEWVADKVASAWRWVREKTVAAVAAVIGFFVGLHDRAVAIVTAIRDRIVALVTAIRDRIVEFFGNARDRAVAIASAIKERVVGFFTGLKESAIEQIVKLIERVKGIKDDILGFFAGAKDWLVQAGKNVIVGLIDGVKSMIGELDELMRSNVAGTIRAVLPFSPAKEGPLSGRGSPDIAGAKIVQMLASGMGSQVGMLSSMADRTAAAALPGLGLPRVQAIGSGGSTGGAGTSGPSTLVIVDADGQLIGRMRVEAGTVVDQRDRALGMELAAGAGAA